MIKNYGLIGHPVSHSMSKKIHTSFYKYYNLEYNYELIDIDPQFFDSVISGYKRDNSLDGFNVTMPFKKDIMKYLDEIDSEAEILGAVNTVKNENGKWYGYNTDGKGFINSLIDEGIKFKSQNIAVLGAGGTSDAITKACRLHGANKMVILNRSLEKAEALGVKVGADYGYISDTSLLKDSDIIINTTSLGMWDNVNESPINDFSNIKSSCVIADVIYNPIKTTLMDLAEKAGLRTLNGWGMLIYQALFSFNIWTEIEFDHGPLEFLTQGRNIILTGFMGSGKSTIGRYLAELLNFDFIDTDEKIEKEYNLSISEIFDKFGEAHFRESESKIIYKAAKLFNTVISLGGGAVLNPGNIDVCRKNGDVFFLDCPVEILYERINKSETRPLSKGKTLEEIKHLYDKRMKFYENCDYKLNVSNKNIDEIFKSIMFERVK